MQDFITMKATDITPFDQIVVGGAIKTVERIEYSNKNVKIFLSDHSVIMVKPDSEIMILVKSK